MNRFLEGLARIRSRAGQESALAGTKALAVLLTAMLAGGCATVPANRLPIADRDGGVMREVLNQKNRMVHLSDHEAGGDKPFLLLLHGATDDPTEMMDIARQWSGEYDVFLYSFNFHDRVEKVGSDLVKEFKRLRAANRVAENPTVVVYSYSAIVFRAAVVNADDRSAFAGASLVQLVPTAGGSRQAQWMAIPVVGRLAALASKLSDAENPYGRLAIKLWEGDGNKKFYEVIHAERVRTILLEGDAHSLATVRNKKIQRRFRNGIGPNVVVIPKSSGVTHEYFPTHPVALAYLRGALESLGNPARVQQSAGGPRPEPPARLAEFRAVGKAAMASKPD